MTERHLALMSTLRRTTPGLFGPCFCYGTFTDRFGAAVPKKHQNTITGLNDWSSLDSDAKRTGLDIQELFTEIMADADDAGFNLTLVN